MASLAKVNNNESMDLCCFISKDKILWMKLFNTNENSCESFDIKCPPPPPESNQESSKTPKSKKVEEHSVISAAVSKCGNFVSAADSSNYLHLWKYEMNSWNHLSQRSFIRKSQKIIFTNSGSEIIIADRGGDVFVFPVADFHKEGKFILGHISLILDIAISANDKYLVTCDRDGKIRVSSYPNSYNIHSYCLGHQEFVSCIQCVQLSQELIMSASGDGSVRLWDFNGDNISTINVFENDVMWSELESYIVENREALLSNILEEKKTTFAVKKIKYSPTNKLCAISFYFIKGVAIYCLSDLKDIRFIEFIPLASTPFGLFFNRTGDLIIVKGWGRPSYFKYVNVDNVLFKELDSANLALSDEFQKFCGCNENLYEVQDDCEALFKRNFDDKDDSVENQTNSSKKNKSSMM